MNRLRYIDWGMMGALAFLAAAGLVTLASVAEEFFPRQLGWYLAALAIILLAVQVDWKRLGDHAWFRYGIYGLSVFLLVVSNLQSSTIRGTKSWIVVGGFQFEPAELAKFALILVLAYFFSRRHVEAWYGKNILVSFVLMAIPTALIMVHPDFGDGVVVVAVWVAFLLMGGVHTKRFLAGLAAAAVAMALMWTFVLKPYQQDRVVSFLFPERDPLGASYNVIQSKVAIGSGGLFGKGFGGGTQARLHFLPAAHNDFLFAAFAEEWGVVGGAALLLTFTFFLYRVGSVGLRAKDNYSRLIALGGGVLFAVQSFINVGSNLGLLPVTGLTFPFFSYGGSSVLTSALLIGIIQHIRVESR
ncbi:MAG: FtsW/RodA/SpoVE family cell cycle protein [Candidatus Jorgensenbacteria bacterium]